MPSLYRLILAHLSTGRFAETESQGITPYSSALVKSRKQDIPE
jgi:hypothetical protein